MITVKCKINVNLKKPTKKKAEPVDEPPVKRRGKVPRISRLMALAIRMDEDAAAWRGTGHHRTCRVGQSLAASSHSNPEPIAARTRDSRSVAVPAPRNDGAFKNPRKEPTSNHEAIVLGTPTRNVERADSLSQFVGDRRLTPHSERGWRYALGFESREVLVWFATRSFASEFRPGLDTPKSCKSCVTWTSTFLGKQ